MGVCNTCCEKSDGENDLLLSELRRDQYYKVKVCKNRTSIPKFALTPSTDLSNLSPDTKLNQFASIDNMENSRFDRLFKFGYKQEDDCEIRTSITNQNMSSLNEDYYLEAEAIHKEQNLYQHILEMQLNGLNSLLNQEQNQKKFMPKIDEIDEDQIKDDSDRFHSPDNLHKQLILTGQQLDQSQVSSFQGQYDDQNSSFSFHTDVMRINSYNQDNQSEQEELVQSQNVADSNRLQLSAQNQNKKVSSKKNTTHKFNQHLNLNNNNHSLYSYVTSVNRVPSKRSQFDQEVSNIHVKHIYEREQIDENVENFYMVYESEDEGIENIENEAFLINNQIKTLQEQDKIDSNALIQPKVKTSIQQEKIKRIPEEFNYRQHPGKKKKL